MIILLSKIQKTIENILCICVCVESIFVYEMIKIAGKPPDVDHPFGHCRAETIASNVIGISLIFGGIMISWEVFAEFGRGKTVGLLMIVGALVAVGSKWLLSYCTSTVGKKYKNQVLVANGKHYFSDVLTSVAVLIGGILIYTTKINFFDSIASFFVTAFIVYMGIDVLKPGIEEIMEKQENPEMIDGIKKIAMDLSVSNPLISNSKSEKIGIFPM